MPRFPVRFAALSCALIVASTLASCSSEPSEDVQTTQRTPEFSPLTTPTSPSPRTGSSAGAGSGEGEPTEPKQTPEKQTPDSEQPTVEPSAGSETGTSQERSDGPAASRTRGAAKLPTGDEKVLDGRRMVALYGAPGTPSLGALGEQPPGKAVKRVKRLASKYADLTKDDVVPAFELIATVASTSAGHDRDFSSELPLSTLRPWVERAAKEGVYVVLDLQPGRSDFVSQAKKYAPLLKYPNVGLALDPEWRLGPKQKHLEQIGSVHGSEVNDTIDWLADLTRRNDLPQKLLVLHQFRTSMIANRKVVQTDRDEVSVLIHADGQGTQPAKRGTWKTLHKGAPKGVRWGWKNFIDEDHPTLTPKQTYQVTPRPDFVSYQ